MSPDHGRSGFGAPRAEDRQIRPMKRQYGTIDANSANPFGTATAANTDDQGHRTSNSNGISPKIEMAPNGVMPSQNEMSPNVIVGEFVNGIRHSQKFVIATEKWKHSDPVIFHNLLNQIS